MGQPVILPSFSAGELSPSLFGRVDLAKWHAGAALLENFFVDYRGGIANRTGTKWIGDSLDASLPSRLIKFIFSASQSYVLVFDHLKMRVIKNGGFVQSGGSDYTIDSPYAAVDLALVKFSQVADVMTLTHPGYTPRQLTRYDHDHWVFTEVNFVPTVSRPTNLAAVPNTGGGTTNYRYVVTAIAANGVTESLPSDPATSANSLSMSTTGSEHEILTWNAVPGSQLYNVYRQPEVIDGSPADGQLFGFVGTTTEPSFIDANIAPDFSRTPPQDFNPFAPRTIGGSLASLAITNAGSGFTARPTVSFSGSGSASATVDLRFRTIISAVSFGANYKVDDVLTAAGGDAVRPLRIRVTSVTGGGAVNGFLINGELGTDFGDYITPPANPVAFTDGSGTGFSLNIDWEITNPQITNSGVGYGEAPTVTVAGGGGAGATMTATITPPVEISNNPACVSYFQQRQVFAGSSDQPDTFFMSKTADFLNFGYSSPARPDDSIIGTLASLQVNEIKHLVPLQSLIVLTAGSAWRIDSGSAGGPVTPSTIDAIPQVFNGACDVPPLVIGRELLYVQSKGAIVRDLSFNFIENVYTGVDLTTLANHLFFGHQIVEWDYAEEPFKIIWAIREDGVLLTFTFLKDQEIYAWAHHVTDGRFKNVCVIPEGEEDAVYVVVERYIQGAKHHYIERFASRDMDAVPEQGIPADLSLAWFVDCGLAYPQTYPAAQLVPSATTADPVIGSVSVIDGGTGYTAPVASITDETGTGAVLTFTVVAGVITAVTVVNPGVNYTNPTIQVTDATGTGAELAANLSRDVLMSANLAVFAAADVGARLRVNHGWGTVRVVQSTYAVIVDVEQPLASTWPAEAGEWTCTRPVSSVSGLHHLEGETVAILANGNVMPRQQVNGGSVTLEQPASDIVVGLPFTGRFQSLYTDIPGEQPTVQGKRKKISAVTLRVQDTRGLRVGHAFNDEMVEVKEREFEEMGNAILPFTGDRRVVMPPDWNVPGQVCAEQVDPLPATILALIPELTIGDTA